MALSPEFIFAGLWGMPDQRGFGVFWVDHEALAAAYDMPGAFNRVAVKLAPGADERAVIDALEGQLARYGGREATAADQPSHAMLDNEIKEQPCSAPCCRRSSSAWRPSCSTWWSRAGGHAARADRRAEGAGLPEPPIAGHYLKMVLAIVAAGFGARPWCLATRWARCSRGCMPSSSAFPSFEHRIAPWLLSSGPG